MWHGLSTLPCNSICLILISWRPQDDNVHSSKLTAVRAVMVTTACFYCLSTQTPSRCFVHRYLFDFHLWPDDSEGYPWRSQQIHETVRPHPCKRGVRLRRKSVREVVSSMSDGCWIDDDVGRPAPHAPSSKYIRSPLEAIQRLNRAPWTSLQNAGPNEPDPAVPSVHTPLLNDKQVASTELLSVTPIRRPYSCLGGVVIDKASHE